MHKNRTVELSRAGKHLSERYKERRDQRRKIRAELKNAAPHPHHTKNDIRKCLKKTGSKCHLCGRRLTLKSCRIDHVKHRARGGEDADWNYLPSCAACNVLRWQMLPDEITEVMRLGVWARGEIERATSAVGRIMANAFAKKEKTREKRCKKPSRERTKQTMTSRSLDAGIQ